MINGLTYKQFSGMALDTLWRKGFAHTGKEFDAYDWRRHWERGDTVLKAIDAFVEHQTQARKKSRVKKNPRPFGKRKATHKAFPRKAPRKPAVKFGKRKSRVTITAKKNPAPVTLYVIRAVHKNGTKYYFTGASFQTEKRQAARYLTSREADEVMNRIEDRLPPVLKFLDVAHV
jgi:hypothetical protein